ncbi:MAG: hypothetical protein Q8Q41_02065 [bacterium]|nr:hypothetical protein [bacterium]
MRDHDYPRLFCGKIERREMRDPDMTPIPRHMSGQLVRLYLPERTIIAPAVLGDEAFDDFFLARYAPEVVVDERGEPGFMDSNGNVVWPEDEMPLFDGAPRKPEGRRKKGWLRRAKSRLRRKNARRRATLARLVTYPHLAPMVERKLP